MAEEEGGWWNSWIQTAKEKSASVLELVRHDLAEFSQTVQQETSSAVSAAASSLKEKLRIDEQDSTANHMKRSVSTFLGSVSTAFTPVREVEDEDDVCIIQNLEPVVMDRLQLQMHLIQRDQSTYLEEPSETLEHYEKWLEGFDLDSKQDEIRELVVANSVIRTMYAKLVPTSISHMIFWHRYFYRIQQLTDAEKRRLDIKERATLIKTDDCLSWDEDEDFGNQELTPQQTDMLLMEYQQECEQSARCDPKDEVNTCEAVDNAIERQSPDSRELVLSLELVQEQEHDTTNEDSVDANLPLPTVTCTTEEGSYLTEKLDESPEELLPASVETCNPEVLDENVAAVVSAEAEVKSSEESSLSNEEEWEKDFDIGDIDIQNASQNGTEASANAIDLNVVNAENDWERWE